MKKIAIMSLLTCAWSLFAIAAPKREIKVNPAFQMVVTDEAFEFNVILLGEYPSYYIVEVLYKGERMVATLQNSFSGRVVQIRGMVTREMFLERSMDILDPGDPRSYDASVSEMTPGEFDGSFEFEVLIRAPTKEEGERVHLTVESLEEDFGTKEWNKIWARGRVRVRATCPNCTQ